MAMSLFATFSLAVLMSAVALLTSAVLIDLWGRADLGMATKLAFTQAYTLSWTLLFENGWSFLAGQAFLALLLGWVTAKSLR
jgi:hypothetical protein